MATGAVATAAAGEHEDDKQHDKDESDHPGDLHPAWCAGLPVVGYLRHAFLLNG